MKVCLAGAGSIVAGRGTAEGVAEASSRSRRRGSGIAQNLSVRAASTGGACRLVAQRSIRMPHCACLGVDEGLQVCCPWPLASMLLVVVEADSGGEQEVWVTGVHRLTLPVPAPISFDLPKRKPKISL